MGRRGEERSGPGGDHRGRGRLPRRVLGIAGGGEGGQGVVAGIPASPQGASGLDGTQLFVPRTRAWAWSNNAGRGVPGRSVDKRVRGALVPQRLEPRAQSQGERGFAAILLKAIHAQEDRVAPLKKAADVVEKLEGMKLKKAASVRA